MGIDQKISNIQSALASAGIDGWLLYDFRRSNDLACEILEIPQSQHLSRRFLYWIPKHGDPVKIAHRIENPIEHLPGQTTRYSTYKELEQAIESAIRGCRKIAMEYSPRNAIPYISKVDGGTLDLIRSFDVEVISSADLLQQYTSVLDEHQIESHLTAAQVLDETVAKAWELIADHLKRDQSITEYDVQQFILGQFSIHNCITADPPIVGVNANSADPHYMPSETMHLPINKGDFILIDLWCKQDLSRAIYADICRVGIASDTATEKQQEVFDIVYQAQRIATELVKSRFAENHPVYGWEVDQSARDVIENAGYGEFFTHRTGHNIGELDHGNGAHMDNFETQDQRKILPSTCFSIEPGIYLPGDFGVRLEYDVLVRQDGSVEVTGGQQDQLILLL